MSPRPRRRSARLATSAVKPRATPELSSLAERDETPPRDEPKGRDTLLSPTRPELSTPMSSALKPPHDEMHPSKREGPQAAALTSTPSKIGGILSSPFTFRFTREAADTALSSDARRMMDQIRGQAAKIKADLIAQKDEGASPKTSGRVIAKLKGKCGRFSAAHTAEFSKMDSIEGHASAWRAQNGRFTPAKSSLKRSPSKANLDATPLSQGSAIKPTPSKSLLAEMPDGGAKLRLKRTSSVANLDYHQTQDEHKEHSPATSPEKFLALARTGQQSTVKRLKQRYEDDSSSARPVSRDGSSLPRPVTRSDNPGSLSRSKSGLARLMSPTKSSMAHAAGLQDSTSSIIMASPKPSQPGIPKSASAMSFGSPSKPADLKRRIISPGRFHKVKSILRGQKIDMDGAKSAIPQPAALVSQTPAPPRTDKALPPLPRTTPRRKFAKRVDFTPETSKAAMAQNSPSPQKPHRSPLQAVDAHHFAGLDEVLAKPNDSLYPDLSPLRRLIEPRSRGEKASSPSMAGTFTFRSDHTIKFEDASAKDFGASPSQSGVRQVRGSMMPATNMPGSFPPPPSPSCHPNKENAAPSPARMLRGTAHGMPNKKRHRASSDEEDAENEAAERALKKRKNEHVPEGQALLAPRLMGKTPASGVKKGGIGRTPSKTPSRLPGRIPGSVSPSKKGSVLSVSRLNMLARPKNRG
ncbi:erythromycin esterase [Hirsutella rhossiliensis]|uniref:Erythromycin esterase n=1 Tax=Hirsutella rhossiliensis TaxID=111463 RepID=A0A9P8N1I3_9HYPO|nr:erythromycin esterase [Hirsutella rhossiliensis]KAH0965938.1 erythromycin esterase [Hirsutella rhossiliensis]